MSVERKKREKEGRKGKTNGMRSFEKRKFPPSDSASRKRVGKTTTQEKLG
jgi:hypothetical protein